MLGKNFFYSSTVRLVSNLVVSAISSKDQKTSPIISFSKVVTAFAIGIIFKDQGGPGNNGGVGMLSYIGEQDIKYMSDEGLDALDM